MEKPKPVKPESRIRYTLMVPTMDRPEWLSRCLDSLQAQDLDATNTEILVSDDSSGVDTRELIETRYPAIRYVKGPARGLAANRNAGIQAASGDWVFITDDDCIAQRGWASAFTRAIEQFPEQCMFEGKTIANRERERINEEAPVNHSGGKFWGCNMALYKPVVQELSGFCEAFRYYGYEDVDFFLKAEKAGYKPYFIQGAVIVHPWRQARSPAKLFSSLHSLRQLLVNHPEQWQHYRLIPRLKIAGSKTLEIIRDLVRYRGRGWAFGLVLILYYYYLPFYLMWYRMRSKNHDD